MQRNAGYAAAALVCGVVMVLLLSPSQVSVLHQLDYSQERQYPCDIDLHLDGTPSVGNQAILSATVTSCQSLASYEIVISLPKYYTVDSTNPASDIVDGAGLHDDWQRYILFTGTIGDGPAVFEARITPASVPYSAHDEIAARVHPVDWEFLDGAIDALYVRVGDGQTQGSVVDRWPYAEEQSGLWNGDGFSALSSLESLANPGLEHVVDFEELEMEAPLGLTLALSGAPVASTAFDLLMSLTNTVTDTVEYTATLTIPSGWVIQGGQSFTGSLLPTSQVTYTVQIEPDTVPCEWEIVASVDVDSSWNALGYDDYSMAQTGGLYPCREYMTPTPSATPGTPLCTSQLDALSGVGPGCKTATYGELSSPSCGGVAFEVLLVMELCDAPTGAVAYIELLSASDLAGTPIPYAVVSTRLDIAEPEAAASLLYWRSGPLDWAPTAFRVSGLGGLSLGCVHAVVGCFGSTCELPTPCQGEPFPSSTPDATLTTSAGSSATPTGDATATPVSYIGRRERRVVLTPSDATLTPIPTVTPSATATRSPTPDKRTPTNPPTATTMATPTPFLTATPACDTCTSKSGGLCRSLTIKDQPRPIRGFVTANYQYAGSLRLRILQPLRGGNVTLPGAPSERQVAAHYRELAVTILGANGEFAVCIPTWVNEKAVREISLELSATDADVCGENDLLWTDVSVKVLPPKGDRVRRVYSYPIRLSSIQDSFCPAGFYDVGQWEVSRGLDNTERQYPKFRAAAFFQARIIACDTRVLLKHYVGRDIKGTGALQARIRYPNDACFDRNCYNNISNTIHILERAGMRSDTLKHEYAHDIFDDTFHGSYGLETSFNEGWANFFAWFHEHGSGGYYAGERSLMTPQEAEGWQGQGVNDAYDGLGAYLFDIYDYGVDAIPECGVVVNDEFGSPLWFNRIWDTMQRGGRTGVAHFL